MPQSSPTGGAPIRPFVPEGFVPPTGLTTGSFRLEPLGEQHNAADLRAWTSSMEHIRATPGFAAFGWPKRVYTLEENAADLRGHARDFAARSGFTYTVRDPASGDVIGCVYLYPSREPGHDVDVHSWVTAARADLDGPLYQAVSAWLASGWPFRAPAYAARGDGVG